MSAQDFGFCGSNYVAANPYQDRQKTVNWFIEVSQDQHSKEAFTLLGAPGKIELATPGLTGEVRGSWVLPGGSQCLWVIAENHKVVNDGVIRFVVPSKEFSKDQLEETFQAGELSRN